MHSDPIRPHCYLTPLAMRKRIAREQPRGLPIINMAFNELPYPPGAEVAEAIAQACTRVNHYGDPGCKALQTQICQHYGVEPDAIICGNGSEELLDVIARNFVQAGDEIVISEFGYIQFELTANRLNAKLRKAPETGFTTDVDALLSTISSATRLVFLANPNNPTGTLAPAADIERLMQALPKQVVLVLDLAYGEFAGQDYCAQMHELVLKHNNLIVTRTFSKAFALAGLRVGWCHAPTWMIPGFYAARGMGTVNAIAQAAATASMSSLDAVNARVAAIVSERDRIAAELKRMGITVIPSEANFLLLGVPGAQAKQAAALVEHIYDTQGILVIHSREAGLESFLRASLSLPEHNNMLLQAVRSFRDGSNCENTS